MIKKLNFHDQKKIFHDQKQKNRLIKYLVLSKKYELNIYLMDLTFNIRIIDTIKIKGFLCIS